MSKSNENKDALPEDFPKLIYDLINDILFTFPEYKDGLDNDLHKIKEQQDSESIKNIYEHFKKVLPERFFDILYKNEDMFQKENVNTEFLPGIDFKNIWKEDISTKTKDTIWKYLQLILFTVIGKVDSQDSFGDTAKLFEAINEDELKDKLEETMKNLHNMMGKDGDEDIIDVSGIDMENLPRPEQIQDHINGLLDGKLGNLAKEIAEETAEELNLNTENAQSVNDVFKQLFKNPGKLMGLVKNVGGKLDSKIKSGEINESEIMKEASDLLSKMKDMPGMGDIQSMMRQMGLNLGKGQKVDFGAMQGKLNQNIKVEQMKERIRQKTMQKQKEKEAHEAYMNSLPPTVPMTNEEIEQLVFSIEGDKPEKTQRSDVPNKKKKKKGKKK
jgi:uncharacterized protein YidB (DUF937 family)|uniref:Uncharacterized protein n=1 Tax=viral metagenome TaxID=1070528 RepID=A0A6C0CJE3_9ZZZZ